MSQIFLKSPYSQPFRQMRHKNIELGSWSADVATDPHKNLWAFFDGTLINHMQLRRELTNLGYVFQTDQAIEVVVHAFAAWREESFAKLNGPMALAIFDEKQECLYLVRDRIGQKSLYWTTQKESFLFATELKGLLATGLVPQTSSLPALSAYLNFGYIPQDLSSIEKVNKLLPGHYLKVNLKREAKLEQYWSLSSKLAINQALSEEEAEEKFGELLEQAVRLCSTGTKRVGSILQEEVGTTMLTWFLSHYKQRNQLSTFSSFYQDEREEYTSEIQKRLKLEGESITFTPEEALHHLPAIVWHLDEPIADILTLRTWSLGRLASRKTSTLFSSVGWEEMLAGHTRYFISEKEDRINTPSLCHQMAHTPSFFRDRLLMPLLRIFHLPARYQLMRTIDINDKQVRYLNSSALFRDTNRKAVSSALYPYFDPEVFIQRFHRLSAVHGAVNPSLYFDMKTALPDKDLSRHQKLLATFGIKVAAPFLENELVDFLITLPDDLKIKENTPGILLRKLMTRLSKDYPTPPPHAPLFIESWASHPEILKVLASLEHGRLVEEGLIHGSWIHKQLQIPHLTPMAFEQLWSILILEIWFRLYINKPIGVQSYEASTKELLGIV